MSTALTEWVLAHFHHSPLHFFIEVGMIVFIIYLLTKKSYRQPTEEKLTTEEEEQLIREWEPKPLVNKQTLPELRHDIILEGPARAHCRANGKDCINMLSNGVFGFQTNPEVIEASIETTKKFGVGSCGPRGFYGSLQPHIDFEQAIASFYGVNSGVLYTSEFQAIATILPAFLKSGDILIADKGVSFAFTNGLGLCKLEVMWFEHNDMVHLAKILTDLKKSQVFGEMKKRVYLAVEAIYANTGDLCPLKEIMRLKEQFPFRIILEESYSIGVLGKTGKGITEHLCIPPTEIEIIAGSVGNALGGMGSFVVGEREMCDHQRLNATGYVFSCALPPFLSAGVTRVLDILKQDNGKMVSILHRNVALVHELINTKVTSLINISASESPYIHLCMKKKLKDKYEERAALHKVVDACFSKGIIFGVSCYSNRERYMPSPTIKISVSKDLSENELAHAIGVLAQASDEILSGL